MHTTVLSRVFAPKRACSTLQLLLLKSFQSREGTKDTLKQVRNHFKEICSQYVKIMNPYSCDLCWLVCAQATAMVTDPRKSGILSGRK